MSCIEMFNSSFKIRIAFLIFWTLAVACRNIGKCVTLTSSSPLGLAITCLGVVDYEYFLPTGLPIDFFNNEAKRLLSDDRLSILPVKCQTSLKKAVCSQIYLKCPTNFNQSNYNTYNYDVFSDIGQTFPIPFQRPCLNICNNANKDCLGLLNLFGKQLNCLDTIDYSQGAFGQSLTNTSYSNPFPYTYDQSNNSVLCNSMPAVATVASAIEPYLFAQTDGACAGIVTSVFVPPGPKVSSFLAPMQQPYIVQSLIEEQIQAALIALPGWISSECHLSLRKYVCGSAFLFPSPKFFPGVLKANNFSTQVMSMIGLQLQGLGVDVPSFYKSPIYLPSYPSAQVCQEYSTSCGAFIASAGVPALVPNCSSVKGGIQQYPEAPQTLMTLPLSASLAIAFQTSPNTMTESADNGYQTTCPDGFVIPDDPGNPRNSMIPGSGCAIACRIPYATAAEYKIYDDTVVIAPAVALPLVLAVIVIWASDKKKRKQGYLVLIFASTSSVATIWLLVMAITKRAQGVSDDKLFCLNNAMTRRQSDGPSMCVVQGTVMAFSSLACSFTWMIQSLDLFIRLVLNWKSYNHFYYHMAFIFGISTILVSVGGAGGWIGYNGVGPICLWQDNVPDSIYYHVYYYPILGTISMGVVLMAAVVAQICMATTSGNGKESFISKLLKKLSILKTSILFVVLYLTFWVSILTLVLYAQENRTKITESLISWVGCIFANFNANDPQAWKKMCGKHPKFRIDSNFVEWSMLVASGQSILVGGVYFNAVILSFRKVAASVRTNASVMPLVMKKMSNTSEFATPTRKSNAKSPKSPYLEQVSEGGSMQESNVYDDSPHSGHWTAGSPSGKYTPPRSLKSPKSPYLPQVRERDYPGVEST